MILGRRIPGTKLPGVLLRVPDRHVTLRVPFCSIMTAKPEWLAAFPPNAWLTLAWPPALGTKPRGSTASAVLGLSPILPVAESKTPVKPCPAGCPSRTPASNARGAVGQRTTTLVTTIVVATLAFAALRRPGNVSQSLAPGPRKHAGHDRLFTVNSTTVHPPYVSLGRIHDGRLAQACFRGPLSSRVWGHALAAAKAWHPAWSPD
jgi:hypothetical protein